MSFVESLKSVVFQNYCNFEGRATRSEYWFFYLAYFILTIVVSGVSVVISDSHNILLCVVMLALLLPMLGVTWRRLHDIGKSGAWFFISLVPIIGCIWLLILLVTPSQAVPNKYGNAPEV